MDHDRTVTREAGQQQAAQRTHLFALRLWEVEVPGGMEYRGTVRNVANGAWRHFRDWSDAQAFLMEQVDEHERDQIANEDGGMS